MADTLISRQTVQALFILPRTPCKVMAAKWRENFSLVPRTSRLGTLKSWRLKSAPGKARI